MWGKLAANPKTAPLLQDQQFVAQVCTLPCTLPPYTNTISIATDDAGEPTTRRKCL
ncbi:hypothetical protein M408DRAFT_328720 [Serendipita vermifera MAFF 305830]|uniref:Uncharacterized protein n=1 Tax=Serendipita vermifera MAFF 305830 TaxID=933852 RepID=A0A0C2WTG6_SERVB|nr:hypothetical protein M408DRAFT_328720 [Serendipita vermifera MAFF 305830]